MMGALPLLLMTSLMLAGCSVLGKRTANEPPYKVLAEEGDIEVRQYGEMIVAETVVEGAYGQTGAPGFSRLAGYIFGKNRSKQKLSMTAPVLQEPVSEKISMTAPVLQEKRGSAWVMAFVMPEGSRLETLPVPLDPAVTLRSVEGKKVGVISLLGSAFRKQPPELCRETDRVASEERVQGTFSTTGSKLRSPLDHSFFTSQRGAYRYRVRKESLTDE